MDRSSSLCLMLAPVCIKNAPICSQIKLICDESESLAGAFHFSFQIVVHWMNNDLLIESKLPTIDGSKIKWKTKRNSHAHTQTHTNRAGKSIIANTGLNENNVYRNITTWIEWKKSVICLIYQFLWWKWWDKASCIDMCFILCCLVLSDVH